LVGAKQTAVCFAHNRTAKKLVGKRCNFTVGPLSSRVLMFIAAAGDAGVDVLGDGARGVFAYADRVLAVPGPVEPPHVGLTLLAGAVIGLLRVAVLPVPDPRLDLESVEAGDIRDGFWQDAGGFDFCEGGAGLLQSGSEVAATVIVRAILICVFRESTALSDDRP